MTPEKIAEYRAIIAGNQELTALANAGNDAKLSSKLSELLPVVPKPGTFLGERGVYNLLGVEAGEAFLLTVEGIAASNSPLKEIFQRVDRWLKDPIGLDVGSSKTQEMLLSLGQTFSDESVSKIIAFGSQKQVISVGDIGEILAADRINGKLPGAE